VNSPSTYSNPGQRLHDKASLSRLARTSIMWAYIRTAVLALIALPTSMVLARLLTPADFGIAAAATFFGQLAARLASGGMGAALVRLKNLRSDHISSIFVLNVVFSAIAGIALIVTAPLVGHFYGTPEVGWLLPLVAVDFMLGAYSMIQQALLKRDLRYKEMATIGALDMTVSSVGTVLFALLGFRFWSFVLGDICGGTVRLLYGVWLVGWHSRFRFVPAAARDLTSFALGSYARAMLEHLTRNVDNLVIGRTLGVTALGFYDKGFSSVNKLYENMTAVGPNVSFRVFAIIQDEPDRFRRAYRKVILTATLLAYPVFAVIATMAPHLVPVAFGQKWLPAVVPMQVLCVSFAFKALNQFATSASQARGWVWPHVWRQIVQVLCVVVGVYLATPWGISGASFAVVGASIVMFYLTQGMMRKATGLGWADILEPQAPSLMLAFMLGAALWGVASLAPHTASHLAVLAVQAGTAALVALLFAWLCPFSDVRALLHEIVSDVSPRIAALVWRDVEAVRAEAKARRRAERAAAGMASNADLQTPMVG
jgi:PST family polysaccharide transporter